MVLRRVGDFIKIETIMTHSFMRVQCGTSIGPTRIPMMMRPKEQAGDIISVEERM